ncbi:MAG: transposase [Cohaesibacteraceae bacterium]|nr:transposase [Cohaesibacteraceae bacterium]
MNCLHNTRTWLHNGFLELDNNTAEWAVKPIAFGQTNEVFAGNDSFLNALLIAKSTRWTG